MKLSRLAAFVAVALLAASASGADPAKSAKLEYDVLRSFPPGRLAALSLWDKPDAKGLCGANRLNGSWLEAGPQRGSCRGVIAAVVAGDLSAANDAWRGIDVAFAHQRADGGFDAEIRPNGESARSPGAAVEPIRNFVFGSGFMVCVAFAAGRAPQQKISRQT